jgi:hypothetical protein
MKDNCSAVEVISLRPQPCKQTERPSRRLFCKYYGVCLDHAASQRWSGFHCGDCTAYEVPRMDRDELKADEIACQALLYWIFWPELLTYVRKRKQHMKGIY